MHVTPSPPCGGLKQKRFAASYEHRRRLMENSLILALARQSVLDRQMDVIATNLANVNTTAYKAEHMIFKEMVEQTDDGTILSVVHDVSFQRDLSEGSLANTYSPFDFAIHGKGFFVVDTADGKRYTRHGVFRLDDQGQIVNTEGHPILSSAGVPIVVPPNGGNVVVNRDGTINVDAQSIGRFQIVSFADEASLSKEGNSLYNAGEQTPQPATNAEIMQGMVEGSNVSGIVEMTRMIDTTRAYQAAGRLAETEHQRILDAIEALVSTA